MNALNPPDFRLGFDEEVVGSTMSLSYYACIPDPARPTIIAAVWWLDREGPYKCALYRDPARKANDLITRSFHDARIRTTGVAILGDILSVADQFEAQLAINHLIQTLPMEVTTNDQAA